MKKSMFYCLMAGLSFFLYQCNNSNTANDQSGKSQEETISVTTNDNATATENNDETDYAVDETDTEKKVWEEANKYKASITDTTFLQTKGKMSDKAIDPFSPNYAYNQVIYLKALERAKKHLVVKDNQLVCTIDSGKKILIAEDLYQYIIDLFKDWNKSIREKQFKIIQTDDGYDIEPIIQKQ